MSSEIVQNLPSNAWAIFLVVLLFGGSIFVHELGHFLAARRRGAHVERFSIGFGPAIWSWYGKDGIEYRVSWIPIGGYVLLPQLADLGAIEGESRIDVSRLPAVSYATKMIVFVAGAAFNVLFAFALACVVWWTGIAVDADLSTTTVAEVLPKIATSDGAEVPGPAFKAGLQSGDTVIAVDGQPVQTFGDIVEKLTLSSGWSGNERLTVFTIRRGDKRLDVPIEPVISGAERTRKVGFIPKSKVIVGDISAGSLAAGAGLKPDDQIVAIDGKPLMTLQQFGDALRARSKPMHLDVLRAAKTVDLILGVPRPGQNPLNIGMGLKTELIHPNPFQQISDSVVRTYEALAGLLNHKSDIGLRQMSGPISIVKTLFDASRAGFPFALWFTILVNVNLAVLNLLPFPVLDGGQMLFATIARLRGRALPTNFIMAAQSVFFVLIFALIGYISLFVDIPRVVRDVRDARAAEAAAQANPATQPATPPASSAAPAK